MRSALLLTATLLATGTTMAAQLSAPPAQPAPPAAEAKPASKASVAGKWTMTVEIDQSQGPAALDIKLTDKKVTGTLSGPGGELPIAGEFADGTLKFSIDYQGQFTIAFVGTFKDDDTMTGTMDFGKGSVNWRAVRVKDK